MRNPVLPRHAAAATLAGLVLLAFPALAPNLFYVHLANMVGITLILTLSLNLIFGYAGQISVGHGGFYAVGAFATALLMTKAGWPFWPAAAAAVAAAALAGALVGIPSLRLTGFYLAMATLGFAIVLYVVLVQWEELTGGPGGIAGISRPTIFGYGLETENSYYYLVLGCVLLTLWITRNLLQSSVGQAMMALRDSPSAAEALGVDTVRYKILAFILSSALAGLAGALFASLSRYVAPSHFPLVESFILLVMVMIGGLGSMAGSVIGALIMVLLPELTLSLGAYHVVGYSVALLVVVMFLPRGLAGGFLEGWERMRRPIRGPSRTAMMVAGQEAYHGRTQVGVRE